MWVILIKYLSAVTKEVAERRSVLWIVLLLPNMCHKSGGKKKMDSKGRLSVSQRNG